MNAVPFRNIVKALTLKRLGNVLLAGSSYLFSALSKKNVIWGKPFILTVEPTNICNLRCPLCVTGNGQMQRAGGMMDLERFQRIIADSHETLIYLLLYQQGEPFLNRDFLSFVRYAKSKKIFVTTSTNAHYFSPAVARETVASGLDSLIISLDGVDQKTYETYRVGGQVEKVIQGIRNLVQEKKRQKRRTPYLYLQFIVMRHNEHQTDRARQLAAELGVDGFLLKTVQVETAAEAESWLPENDALRRYTLGDGNLKLRRQGKGPCPRPWTSTLINWNGTVVPCCFDKNASFELGRLSANDDISTIWNSSNYARFRKTMLRDRQSIGICANCTQGVRFYL